MYYFDQDGNRLHSTVYKGYAFDQDGVMIENSWTKLENQWYYAAPSGRLTQNAWKKSMVLGTILTKLESCSAIQALMAIS